MMTAGQNPVDPAWGIWGNEAAVERMQRAARTGPRHAYILSGPPSIGKSRLAAAFAKALACNEGDAPGVACGSCSACRRVTSGVHPDVQRFDLAYQAARDDNTSKNMTMNIATVRDISHQVALRPVEASWRMVIVDDVETMQETAQEAFLKTLEEPPAYAVILLLTNDAELLLPTILSRCSLVTMSTSPNAVIERALSEQGAERDEARILAIASRGKVGLALTALADETLRGELLDAVEKASAWIGADQYGRMVESVRLADRFGDSREAVFDQLLAVEVAWRELLCNLAAPERLSDHPVVSSYHLGSLRDGHRALMAIDRCLRDLSSNVRPRAALESMVLRWPAVKSGSD